jgi:predicted nuclease of restriction endonuclease-like (RecB) superfamily
MLMNNFTLTYPDIEIVQRALHNLSWWHNIVIVEKTKDCKQREWYIAKTIENSWSRDVLVHQIESDFKWSEKANEH